MYDDQPQPRTGRLLLLALAALMAVAIPFVLVSQFMSSHTGASASPPATASIAERSSLTAPVVSAGAVASSSGPAAAQAQDPLAAETDACRLANRRERKALSAAAASLEQFQKHIDAMNQLVSGTISLATATMFWDQTRVAAQAKVRAFQAADKAVTTKGATCPELLPTEACSAPLEQVNAITDCAKAELGRLVVLSRARTAVTTWSHHVHDMEMLRMGQLSPSQATSLWQQNWKKGQRQVDSYLAASQLVDSLKCPLS
jgi:hypothetical protein